MPMPCGAVTPTQAYGTPSIRSSSHCAARTRRRSARRKKRSTCCRCACRPTSGRRASIPRLTPPSSAAWSRTSKRPASTGSSCPSSSRYTTRSSCRAKWAMLLAGNYRCVQKDGIRPIKDAVHSDLEASRSVYNWVVKLCVSLGADEKDLVPFEKYASAALSLLTPSSAARALANGAPNIERTDRLVQTIAAQKGMRSDEVDRTVALVEGCLEKNRKKAA